MPSTNLPDIFHRRILQTLLAASVWLRQVIIVSLSGVSPSRSLRLLLPGDIQIYFQALAKTSFRRQKEAAADRKQMLGRTPLYELGLRSLKPINISILFQTKPGKILFLLLIWASGPLFKTGLIIWYNFPSSLVNLVSIRESIVLDHHSPFRLLCLFSTLVRSFGNGAYLVIPVRAFPVLRFLHPTSRQAFALQTVTKRALIGLLEDVSFWSSFGKCEASFVKHLDPIDKDVVLGDYHRSSMLSKHLSFPVLLSAFVMHVVLKLPFEDLEEFTPHCCNETF